MFIKKEIRVLLLIIGSLGIYVYFSDPLQGPILPCIFNKITGWYCPGCGMTRAVHSILRLNFYQAVRFNALIFIIPLPLILYYFMQYKGKYSMGKVLLVFMIIVVLAYGIMRNLDVFRFLAPTII